MTRANKIDKHVGKRLRAARRASGLTVQQIANALSIDSHSHILNYETAYTRCPPGRLLPMARLYRKPIQWFFAGAPK
jgi:transcriptional regulator with XRE-family HTH domain